MSQHCSRCSGDQQPIEGKNNPLRPVKPQSFHAGEEAEGGMVGEEEEEKAGEEMMTRSQAGLEAVAGLVPANLCGLLLAVTSAGPDPRLPRMPPVGSDADAAFLVPCQVLEPQPGAKRLW